MLSYELWNIVKKGFDVRAKKKEEIFAIERKYCQNAKSLEIIQRAISDQIFPRIATQETTKSAYDVLKQEFVGDKQVKACKLQGLHHDFEYTRMAEHESLSTYIV